MIRPSGEVAVLTVAARAAECVAARAALDPAASALAVRATRVR